MFTMVDYSDHLMYRIQVLSDSRATFDKTMLHGINFIGNKVKETAKNNALSNLGDKA